MDLEYLKYCTGKLSGGQFVVYLALKQLYEELGEGTMTTANELAQYCNLHPETIALILPQLQAKGYALIVLVKTMGTSILWVRRSVSEKQPDLEKIDRKHSQVLIAPNGKTYRVALGEVADFCRLHQLKSEGIYSILRGEQETHRGWRRWSNPNKREQSWIPKKHSKKVPQKSGDETKVTTQKVALL